MISELDYLCYCRLLMNSPSPLREKSFHFAVKIVKFGKLLIGQHEYVLGKQIVRSGTSIGANIREANSAPTKKDFAHKLSISLKEAQETHYWLELIQESIDFTDSKLLSELTSECNELIALLTSILKTTRRSLANVER